MRVPDFYFLKVTYPQVHRRKRGNAGEIPGRIPKSKRGPEVSASRLRHLFMNALIIQLFRLNRERL